MRICTLSIILLKLLSLAIQAAMNSVESTIITTGLKRIGIVGAGAAGLIAADVLKRDGFQVTVFDKQSTVGGVWKYAKPSGPMYKSLRTNLPKEIVAFCEAEPFNDDLPSFLTHYDVQAYLVNFATKRQLLENIRFSTSVDRITALATHPVTWKVETTSSAVAEYNPTGNNRPALGLSQASDIYDAVIICNGHYNKPLTPTSLPGLESFRGRITHSKDYDIPDIFTGKRVLVVGSRSSGTDMAREIAAVASEVYVADRSLNPALTAQYGNIYHKPSVIGFRESDGAVLFADNGSIGGSGSSGSSASSGDSNGSGSSGSGIGNSDISNGHGGDSAVVVDEILWCTGFAYDYPFLDEYFSSAAAASAPGAVDVNLSPRPACVLKGRKVANLYQQLFSIAEPTLAFIGLPFNVVPFPIFRLQAEWISSVFSGKKQLPPLEEQVAWYHEYENTVLQRHGGSVEKAEEKYHYLGGDLQWEYCRMLAHKASMGSSSSESSDSDLCNSNDSSDLRGTSKLELERELKYLETLREIYTHVSTNRPAYPGAPDDYRDTEYRINRETLEWTVQSWNEGGRKG